MDVKFKKIIPAAIAATAFIFTVLLANSSSETTRIVKIPNDLIVAKPKKRNPSLAISVKATLAKLRQKQNITLVDIRGKEDFERLKISGSINIPLHFIKTKTFLKSLSLVLINEGFLYTRMEEACRSFMDLGFTVSILDGGISAWSLMGNTLEGDLLALNTIREISPQVFFNEKDYESSIVVDVSPKRSEESQAFFPNALHLPHLGESPASVLKLKQAMNDHNRKPFTTLLLVEETGEGYEKIKRIMSREKINAFYLKGGVATYGRYLRDLALSRQPRESRLMTISPCKPCGERGEDVGSRKTTEQ